MLREEKRKGTTLGVQTAKLTSQGKLLPDSVIVELTRTWLEDHGGEEFVLDGFPRTIGQADALAAMLDCRGTPLEIVLALEAPTETLQHRVASRMVCQQCGAIVSVGLHVKNPTSPCPRCGGLLGRRSDDSPEILVARLEEYREKTEPLLEYYDERGLLHRVDSGRPPEVVFRFDHCSLGSLMIPIKNEREIQKMRLACQVASSILERVCTHVRPGITTREVDQAAADYMSDEGCKSAFLGYRGFPGNICISVNEEVVHAIGGPRRIQYGDIVKLDIGVFKNGWVGRHG